MLIFFLLSFSVPFLRFCLFLFVSACFSLYWSVSVLFCPVPSVPVPFCLFLSCFFFFYFVSSLLLSTQCGLWRVGFVWLVALKMFFLGTPLFCYQIRDAYPAYGRHWISQPMQIEAPIPFYIFIYRWSAMEVRLRCKQPKATATDLSLLIPPVPTVGWSK